MKIHPSYYEFLTCKMASMNLTLHHKVLTNKFKYLKILLIVLSCLFRFDMVVISQDFSAGYIMWNFSPCLFLFILVLVNVQYITS